MKKLLVSIICGFCCLGIARAQGLDCNEAQTYGEKVICNNPSLHAMYNQLWEVFKMAKDKAGNSDVFQTIARGNLALRDKCQNQKCVEKWLEDSTTLYQYLFAVIPSDNFVEYPKEIQKICKNQATTTDTLACGNAQLNYRQGMLNSQIHKLLEEASSEKQKTMVQSFYNQWRMDRIKYCTLEFSCPNQDALKLKISGCFLRWTNDLCEKTKDAKTFLKGLASSSITDESVVRDSMD